MNKKLQKLEEAVLAGVKSSKILVNESDNSERKISDSFKSFYKAIKEADTYFDDIQNAGDRASKAQYGSLEFALVSAAKGIDSALKEVRNVKNSI